MKKFINILIGMLVVLVCFVIQTTVLRGSTGLSFRPNLLIIAVVSLSLFLGDTAGVFLGFFAGILCDICFGPLLGFHALLFAWTGYLCGRFTGILFIEDLKFPLLLIEVSDFLYCFCCYIFEFMFRARMFAGFFTTNYIIPEMICTLLTGVILYPLLSLLYRRVMKEKTESQKRQERSEHA